MQTNIPFDNTNVEFVESIPSSPVMHTIAIEKLKRSTIIIRAQLKHIMTRVNLLEPHSGGLLERGRFDTLDSISILSPWLRKYRVPSGLVSVTGYNEFNQLTISSSIRAFYYFFSKYINVNIIFILLSERRHYDSFPVFWNVEFWTVLRPWR